MNFQNISIADYYIGFLQNLNSNSKLDLITKLSQSMKEDENKQKESSLDTLFGALQTNETADELIEQLRQARTFNRQIETL